MRTGVVLLGLAAGCGFHGGAAQPEPDGAEPLPDACTTFSSQLATCPLPLTADLTLSGTVTYDTTQHVLTIDGVATPVVSLTVAGQTGDVDAILARDVHLTAHATLRATGALPFAIIAGGQIAIEEGAVVDVGNGGAGARASCDAGPTAGEASSDGAGGGGGAGFGAAGGDGGKGNSDFGGQHAGGHPGARASDAPLGPLGGCPGAPGGKGDVDGGAGGPGGGALYLVAARSITLGAGATLSAGGGGGGGGGHATNKGDAGGGGGGSGGMIVVEAPQVVATQAVIAANGGGGGEGSAEEAGGNPGAAGQLSSTRATGGHDGVGNGGDGGAGGSADGPEGAPGQGPKPGGGGGGGGGIGFIRILSASPELGTVSPAPAPVSQR